MPKAGFIVARVSFLMLAASMLGVAMLAVPAAGQTSCAPPSGKCFGVTVSPSSATAGVSTSFMFTITNEASTQTLGSVQVSAPPAFQITSSGLFTNLNLAPGKSTTLTLSAAVGCSSGSYTWGIAAKQSNNFNGTGNDFQLDPNSAKNLNGTFTGSCSLKPCPPSTACSGSVSSATTSGTVTTSAAEPGDFIETGMESVGSGSSFNFSCKTYTPVSDAFGFAVFNSAGVPQPTKLTGTLRIDKSLVNSSGHPGASSWQICYASTTQFNALAGTGQQNVTIGGSPGYFTGLLPDCSSSQGAPCVQSRNKNNAGDVVVGFLADGDPYGRG